MYLISIRVLYKYEGCKNNTIHIYTTVPDTILRKILSRRSTHHCVI